jgi:hypothetical protein
LYLLRLTAIGGGQQQTVTVGVQLSAAEIHRLFLPRVTRPTGMMSRLLHLPWVRR